MKIKEYLELIGITFEDDNAAIYFLSQYEIRNFILEKYNQLTSLQTQNEDGQKQIVATDKDLIDFSPSHKTDEVTKYCDDISPLIQPDKEQTANNSLQYQNKGIKLILPNAKNNYPYSFTLNTSKLSDNNIEVLKFEGLEKVGLTFNTKTKTIEGVPTTSGDHTITCLYKKKDIQDPDHVFQQNLKLVINPDPRSLWNTIPTPSNIEFYKEDSAHTFHKGNEKNIIVASQRGRSHAHAGKPRDDDYAFIYDATTDWYIMAVSDGAGSAKYGRRGSQIACQTVITTCRDKLKDVSISLEKQIENYHTEKDPDKVIDISDSLYTILGHGLLEAYKNINNEAKRTNHDLRDFATTLLITICKKTTVGWFIASLGVGDGVIAIYERNQPYLRILGDPDGGEFAGQTRFITMTEIIQPTEIYNRLSFDLVDDFTSLMLITDGVTDAKFETNANLKNVEKWHALWNDLSQEISFDAKAESSTQLLKWLDFWSQGNHDDRTIMIMY